MYVVAIGVPFRRIDADRCQVAADWGKSLLLLRDSLKGRFGPVLVAAPELNDSAGPIGNQLPMDLSATHDQIHFHSLGSARWRTREFWMSIKSVRAACNAAAAQAMVVHAGINNLYQPFSLMGFYAGRRLRKTTVFVIDGDMVTRSADLTKGKPLRSRVMAKTYSFVLERLQRCAVRDADLSLLKGDLLIDRYSRYAKNPQKFYDTSYALDGVISSDALAHKLSTRDARPFKILSLGRLVDIKNTDHVVIAFAEACRAGLNAKLDIIGGGPEHGRLESLISQQKIGDHVTLVGARPYDEALLRDVSTYDLMVFASTSEETPRSLFDAMAGGCAILSYDIPFAKEIIGASRCGILAKRGSIPALRDGMVRLASDRQYHRATSEAARAFALLNSANQWYARRAKWTDDAFVLRRQLNAQMRRHLTDVH